MEEEEIKPVKKRPIALIVIIAVLGVAAMVGVVLTGLNNKFVNYNYTLFLSAKALNIGCPKMVSDNLRLDSVAAKVDLQLWYYYTQTDMLKEEDFADSMCVDYKDAIVENLKGNKDMAEFGKNKVILVFRLADKQGEELCAAHVGPDEYYSSPK